MVCSPIEINAPNVILDLRGFSVATVFCRTCPTIHVVDGNVTIRNGGVFGLDTALTADSPARVRLENIRSDSVALPEDSYVFNSRFSAGTDDAGLSLRGNSTVLETTCRYHGPPVPCIYASGDNIVFSDNRIAGDDDGTSIWLEVSNSVVEGNIVGAGGIEIGNSGMSANNIVKDNIVRRGDIDISGSGTVVDGNVVPDGGISFGDTWNFYGDNRVSTGFSGTSGQTDWGGNVSY